MTKYCVQTGEPLTEVGDFREHWCNVYRSSVAAYIEIADPGKADYPLITLQRGVIEKLESAAPALLALALSRLRPIDCRTISVLAFEYTLLGCYRADADYRIVYPDGSTR